MLSPHKGYKAITNNDGFSVLVNGADLFLTTNDHVTLNRKLTKMSPPVNITFEWTLGMVVQLIL